MPNTALYGKTYLNAAKDTWGLFVDRGIDALVNDSLVGMSRFYYKPSTVAYTNATNCSKHSLGERTRLASFPPYSHTFIYEVNIYTSVTQHEYAYHDS